MKIKSIFLSMLAIAALTSCDNTDSDELMGGSAQGVSTSSTRGPLVVALPGAPDVYAVEDTQNAGPIIPLYSDAVVYLVDAGGNAVDYTWTDAEIAQKYKQFEEISLPSKVIVVVNKGTVVLPTGTTTETAIATALESVTIADQNKSTVTLAAADGKGNAAGDYESVKQVTLYGESTTIEDGTPWDGHSTKKCDITLKSLVSRFEVGKVKAGAGLISLEVEAVYVNNFYTTYGKAANQSFTEFTWPTAFTPDWATNTVSADVTSVDGTKCYAYQVLTGMIPHIIYKVKGETDATHKLTDGTQGVFSGKYITVRGFKEANVEITTIEANKIYKMGLTDGGIEITPDEITDKPEKSKYDLQVNITVAPWTSATVTPII